MKIGRLTPELRGRVTGLVDSGMSFRAVGLAVGCDGKTVAKWINRFRTTGNMKDLPRPGRPRVTLARQDVSEVTQDMSANKKKKRMDAYKNISVTTPTKSFHLDSTICCHSIFKPVFI